jgi:hypothetical protein
MISLNIAVSPRAQRYFNINRKHYQYQTANLKSVRPANLPRRTIGPVGSPCNGIILPGCVFQNEAKIEIFQGRGAFSAKGWVVIQRDFTLRQIPTVPRRAARLGQEAASVGCNDRKGGRAVDAVAGQDALAPAQQRTWYVLRLLSVPVRVRPGNCRVEVTK